MCKNKKHIAQKVFYLLTFEFNFLTIRKQYKLDEGWQLIRHWYEEYTGSGGMWHPAEGCCSLTKSCPTLCNPMDCSTHLSPVICYLPEFAQMHVFLELLVMPSALPSSTVDTFWPGGLIIRCPIFLPFHTVQGVFAARIRGWGATSSSSGPHLVGAFHCGLSVLRGPAQHGSQLHRVTKASSAQQGCDPRWGPGRKQAPFRAGEGGSPN